MPKPKLSEKGFEWSADRQWKGGESIEDDNETSGSTVLCTFLDANFINVSP
jgi:hypothetical protein